MCFIEKTKKFKTKIISKEIERNWFNPKIDNCVSKVVLQRNNVSIIYWTSRLSEVIVILD